MSLEQIIPSVAQETVDRVFNRVTTDAAYVRERLALIERENKFLYSSMGENDAVRTATLVMYDCIDEVLSVPQIDFSVKLKFGTAILKIDENEYGDTIERYNQENGYLFDTLIEYEKTAFPFLLYTYKIIEMQTRKDISKKPLH